MSGRPFAGRKTEEPEDRPDLASVLSHYGIDVDPGRSKQMILCFAHSEDQKSCSVNLDKGLWTCFSCGAGGDSWTAIELLEGGVDHRTARQAATKHQFATRADGGSDSALSSRYGRTYGSVAAGSRTRQGSSPYRPRWRRD